ncbi:MAG: Gfo/Idh/MocA family oxidoreductase [Verrucomicrobia bacterium]|nr:Gfo/Idh/MocA family oxidoreductase [Verrucomicrobiota bacterium]
MKKHQSSPDLSRRTFLKGSSFSTLMSMLGGVPLIAQEQPKDAPAAIPVGRTVKCGVIGLGPWGREILSTLVRFPEAKIVAVCDTYPAMVRRAQQSAPGAEATDDYRKVLANQEVEAVVVATPSHLHRNIVIEALKAGKHVHCEVPLAHTVEDARAIAKAAKAAFKVLFQSGLQNRSHPQRHFLLQFIRAGAMGKSVMVRAQWHRKQQWRFTSPNADREKEINWRLSRSTSPGLIGEIGIHHIDMAGWFLDTKPLAVTGFGSLILWNDGRDVPDTIQSVFEHPQGVNFLYHSTIANSFESDYEVYFGSDSAIMVRENKAWMFKEVDAPLLGWEVYARKDSFYKETGIALVMDASKLEGQGENASQDAAVTSTPLYYALEAFLRNAGKMSNAVTDFTANFGNDDDALKEYLAETFTKSRLPAAGYQEGFEATVIALKANEAIMDKKRIVFQKEWFELG